MIKELEIGVKVYFKGEKRPYTVKAADDRYAICTKPFNLQKTVLYTIIDFRQGIRGTNNYVFNPYDYMVQEEIDQCLKDLQSGETRISHRNNVDLYIQNIV